MKFFLKESNWNHMSHRESCTPMFIAALFTRAKNVEAFQVSMNGIMDK